MAYNKYINYPDPWEGKVYGSPVISDPTSGYSEYERNKASMMSGGGGGSTPTTSTGLGSRPFFIPSGKTTEGIGGRVPGQTYGPSGPTGQYMTAPTMGPMPEFKLPIWDESAIESRAQRTAGPGLRELRKGMREAQGRYYENPNVRRMTLRDAMAGYGMGLEKVLGGARQQATAEYAAEYAPQMTKAQTEYQGQVQQMMGKYENAWREYLARMTTTQGGG